MKLSKSYVLFLLVVGLLGFHRNARAATLAVDRTDDSASAKACTASANDCSLRGAIINSNASDGADTINLPAGTYVLSIAGADEEEAATGDLDITDDLTINGAGAKTTIVDGGAIDRVLHIQPIRTAFISHTITINDLTVTNGLAPAGLDFTAGYGGGLWINDNENITLNRLIIRDNHVSDATAGGGGIYLTGVGPAITISRSTIKGNAAGTNGSGGGLFVDTESDSITIVNSTITGNSAGGRGGGLNTLMGTLTLNNDTIAKNTAGTAGGGISNDSASLKMRNTLLAANTAGQSPDCDGTVTSQGHNLVTNASDCSGVTGPNDLIGNDPKLDPAGLKNNGGPTTTIALLTGSAAVNAGNDATCRSHDQRGLLRPQGAHCDIGAYEKGPCGDHFLEPEEQCDDSNTTNGDGCSASCVDEVPGEVCGNGALETGEECDDGNTASGDGCSDACVSECDATCQSEDGGTGGTGGTTGTTGTTTGGTGTGGGDGGGCGLMGK